eukprot:15457215-Alexandrium_andersonii.AAC.1
MEHVAQAAARTTQTQLNPATEDSSVDHSREHAYHVETHLPNGKPALLLDVGSVGNLAGDEWARQQAAAALKAGQQPTQRRREHPLNVRGVWGRRSEVRARLRVARRVDQR